jgi:AraC-like DNA-binding protein
LKWGDEEWRPYQAAVVNADEPHAFNADGVLGMLMLIDPESREGRWLRRSMKSPITELPAARLPDVQAIVRKFWEEPPDEAATAAVVETVVRLFCTGIPPQQALDERITNAIEFIQSMDVRVVSLDEVAARMFLSPSRFAHLFSDEVGIPFRRYLLWRRLNKAMVLVTRGETLSRAAHEAGFSDAAHFTRTFNQMFGIPPSAMLGQGEMLKSRRRFSGYAPAGRDWVPGRQPWR